MDEQVSLELGTDHISEELLCNTHPALMFNREMVTRFTSIEKEIGKDKLYSSVMVNASSSCHDTVLEQYIDFTMRLISSDFDHKSWNYSEQFSKHISPHKNIAVKLIK